MPDGEQDVLAELADGTLSGPEWDAWLVAHPQEAAEVDVAWQVRQLLRQLEAASIPVPAGFEERLMQRVREDATFVHLLDLLLSGVGRTLLEFLDLIFGPQPQLQPRPQPAG